jgi:hypothetical protein
MVGSDSDVHHGFSLTGRERLCGSVSLGLLIVISAKLLMVIEAWSVWIC